MTSHTGDSARSSRVARAVQAAAAGAVICLWHPAAVVSQTPPLAVRWVQASADSSPVTVQVSGLSPNAPDAMRDWDESHWRELLAVQVVAPKDAPPQTRLPAMAGSYRIEPGRLHFLPRFPLERGVAYQAIFRPSKLPGSRIAEDEVITARFEMPAAPQHPTTVVSAVYPSADVLPENLLKFYLQFSAPMSRGRIYDWIKLLDASGMEVELPFLEIDEELWDPAMSRLTLFLDPGRIKRGVLPLEEVGPALESGKTYTLQIDPGWKDAKGNPLMKGFRKKFKVGPPDRKPPEPAQWKVQRPKAGTAGRLTIRFPEPLDHALARRLIWVEDRSGRPVKGTRALSDRERCWTMIPETRWARGSYRIMIQTTIEDLAGNNVGKPFEVDLFDGVQRKSDNTTVTLPVEIR